VHQRQNCWTGAIERSRHAGRAVDVEEIRPEITGLERDLMASGTLEPAACQLSSICHSPRRQEETADIAAACAGRSGKRLAPRSYAESDNVIGMLADAGNASSVTRQPRPTPLRPAGGSSRQEAPAFR